MSIETKSTPDQEVSMTRGERWRNTAIGMGLVAVGAAATLKYGVDVAGFVDIASGHVEVDAVNPEFVVAAAGMASGLGTMALGGRRLEASQAAKSQAA